MDANIGTNEDLKENMNIGTNEDLKEDKKEEYQITAYQMRKADNTEMGEILIPTPLLCCH